MTDKLYTFAQLIDRGSVGLPKTEANQSTLNTILTMVFVLIGALAVLMIIIAGLRYILARGDPQKITDAKNTILYALVGLVLAASAAAIVEFVVNRTP